MGHVILGLEHVSTGNWKHETHRLVDIPGGSNQGAAPNVGICVICLHLQNTVDWLFTLRQDGQKFDINYLHLSSGIRPMSMWTHIVFFLLTVIMFGCMTADQSLEPDWIVDQADVLEVEDEYALMNMLSGFYDSSSVALVGVTVESLQQQSIEAYTEALYASWELGAPETNNGIMVLLAPVERLVHITVGSGIAWELSAQVLDSIKIEMATFFGTGEYRAGLESGFRSLMTRAGALTWNVDYTSISDVQAGSSHSVGRILMTDCVITGFEEDLVVATDDGGNEIRLIVSMDVPMLSVEDVIGFTGRITQTTPLQAQVLNLSIDFPF